MTRGIHVINSVQWSNLISECSHHLLQKGHRYGLETHNHHTRIHVLFLCRLYYYKKLVIVHRCIFKWNLNLPPCLCLYFTNLVSEWL